MPSPVSFSRRRPAPRRPSLEQMLRLLKIANPRKHQALALFITRAYDEELQPYETAPDRDEVS
jgi:hypothetical protein